MIHPDLRRYVQTVSPESAPTIRSAPGRAAFGGRETLDPMPPADHRVTLLIRANCHLCDNARAVLAALAGELGVRWEELDVDADAELGAEYGALVPVVLVDGVETGYLDIDEPALRSVLLD
ncbi:MAG TPA: glutaredoxin family protein [Mycobacteriales bacterium]|jgi:Glutaredoxin-like domain (DUF836).